MLWRLCFVLFCALHWYAYFVTIFFSSEQMVPCCSPQMYYYYLNQNLLWKKASQCLFCFQTDNLEKQKPTVIQGERKTHKRKKEGKKHRNTHEHKTKNSVRIRWLGILSIDWPRLNHTWPTPLPSKIKLLVLWMREEQWVAITLTLPRFLTLPPTIF